MSNQNNVAGLQFVVQRDNRVTAAFARKSAALEWAQGRSYQDESQFTVHDGTTGVVLTTFRDGEGEDSE